MGEKPLPPFAAKVYAALDEHEGMNQWEIAQHIGEFSGSVLRALVYLKRRGLALHGYGDKTVGRFPKGEPIWHRAPASPVSGPQGE